MVSRTNARGHTVNGRWGFVLLLLLVLLLLPVRAGDMFNQHTAYAGPESALACGTYYQDPQCREDCGGCGNACCVLQWTFTLSPVEFEAALRNSTSSGGPDGLYGFVGNDTFEGSPLLLQATHLPPGARQNKFVDDLSFAVNPHGSGCVVTAFSKTRIVSSHCDRGRNYANLESLLAGMAIQSYEQITLHGCPLKL